MISNDKICLRVTPDVRSALEKWAHENLTTMTAELARSVRERAARERQAVVEKAA